MAMKRILTTSQREQLLSVDHLSEEDFKAYFSFSDYDLEVINQHRGKVNKLGFAIQLCLARYPGCSLSNWPIKSTRLTSYVSRQLHLDAIDLNSYDHRNTRANHFNEILEVFNYHRFGSANTQKQLIEYLIELALENDDSIYLMKKTIDFLTRKRIIFPSIATLEDIISRCRDKAENNLFSILLCSLTDIQIEKLESLFQIYEETKITKLAWLKDIPGKANPESFMSICKKVEVIASMGLGTINVSNILREHKARQQPKAPLQMSAPAREVESAAVKMRLYDYINEAYSHGLTASNTELEQAIRCDSLELIQAIKGLVSDEKIIMSRKLIGDEVTGEMIYYLRIKET